MQGIGAGVLIAVILIVFFRRNTSLSREIDDLKERVSNIEEQLNNPNK